MTVKIIYSILNRSIFVTLSFIMHELHSRLSKSFSWYDAWHKHPHHQHAHWFGFFAFLLVMSLLVSVQTALYLVEKPEAQAIQSANYATNPFVINLPKSLTQDLPGVGLGNGAGGVFANDLNGDGLMDFVITNRNAIAAYDHFGTQLWLINDNIWLSEYGAPGIRSSYPGYHNPGVIAG